MGIGGTRREVEARLDYTRRVIAEYLRPGDQNVVHFHLLALPGEDGAAKPCLIIAIAQTNAVVGVKDRGGRFTYPVQRETGLHRAEREELARAKAAVKDTNYGFVHDLAQFTYER